MKILLYLFCFLILLVFYSTRANAKNSCRQNIGTHINFERSSDSEQQQEIRLFVVTNYRNIVFDVIAKRGQYFDGLAELLKTQNKQLLLEQSKCIILTNESIPDVARAFSSLYGTIVVLKE